MLLLEEFLFALEWGVKLDQAELLAENNTLLLQAHFTLPKAVCPQCNYSSGRVHSRRVRHPTDLPLAGRKVKMALEVRRFFCDNPNCPKRTFVEQTPPFLAFRARRTVRQSTLLKEQAFASGGELWTRNLKRMEVVISPDTLLRLIKKAPLPQYSTPRVLGVDDWAFRRGRNYGTILVDLEQHQVVDLLPERSAQSLAKWLREHPGVEIVSRDRASCYAEGIEQGAPGAIQVADRFHLLKNLTDHLKDFFDRNYRWLRQITEPETSEMSPVNDNMKVEQELLSQTLLPIEKGGEKDKEAQDLPGRIKVEFSPAVVEPLCEDLPEQIGEDQHRVQVKIPKLELMRQARQSRRQLLLNEVKELHQKNYSDRRIAQTLKLSRNTVKKYLGFEDVPLFRPRGKQVSKLDPYKSYLIERWKGGCQSGLQLYQEIKEKGYTGSRGLVRLFLSENCTRLTPSVTPSEPPQKRKSGRQWKVNLTELKASPVLSSRQAVWLIVKPDEKLEQREGQLLIQLLGLNEEIRQIYELSQQFVTMVKEKQAGQLESWLALADRTNNRELNRLAEGIRRDKEAVLSGLSLKWSQGQVEGQVNRLKTLKRGMYGRAGFELLKSRVLYAA